MDDLSVRELLLARPRPDGVTDAQLLASYQRYVLARHEWAAAHGPIVERRTW